jgi:hypothetical protein
VITPAPTALPTNAPTSTTITPVPNPSPTATVTTALAGGPATRPGGSRGGGGGPTGRGGGNGGTDGFSLGLPGFRFSSVSGPFFAWLGTTIGGVLLFLFLVRRRREDAPSLATFVLESPGPVAPPVIAPIPVASAADPLAVVGPTKDPEPRRRSGGRKGSKPSGASGAGASAFAKRPAKGVERVFVSYRGVQMGETPEDGRPMVARLERGDEIEIIGSQEGYLNVRTPSGLTGWIPRGTVTGTPPSTQATSTPAPN